LLKQKEFVPGVHKQRVGPGNPSGGVAVWKFRIDMTTSSPIRDVLSALIG
jgi:hypothetical protein